MADQAAEAVSLSLADAAARGVVEEVSTLVASASQSDLDDALEMASEAGRSNIVRLLLDHRAKADCGVGAAAATGHMATLKLLLSGGGSSAKALAGAAEAGQLSTGELALELGANPSPGLQLAAEFGNEVGVVGPRSRGWLTTVRATTLHKKKQNSRLSASC